MPPHEHKAERTLEVCACGATRPPEGEWTEAGQAASRMLVSRYLDNSTPEERSANARKGAKRRWKGAPKSRRREYMQYVASAPRPNARIADRCPCGKFSRTLAEKRGHKCEAGR